MACGPNHTHQALSGQCPSSPPGTALCIPLWSCTWLTCRLPIQKQTLAFFLTHGLQVAALPHSLQPPQHNWVSPSSEKAYDCGHLCSYRPASLDQVSMPHSLYSNSQAPKIPSLICHPHEKAYSMRSKKNPMSGHWWIPPTLEPKTVGIIREGKEDEKEKWRKGGKNRGSYLHPAFSPNYERNTEHSSPERDILSQ